MDTANLRYRDTLSYWATITARIQSSRDILELIMVVDALRAWNLTPLHLVLPCLPYQRQDRRCVVGESFSLKAFAQLINGLAFEQVTVFDPHSDVTGAVIDRVKIIDQSTIIGKFDKLNAALQPNAVAPSLANPFGESAERPVFVSPDSGANKKTAELAKLYAHDYFIRADKLRDLATGKIKEIVVTNPREEVEGRKCLICDDICDGGATFTGLATALKAKGAAKVDLYVTHGLFTKALSPLLTGGIDHIYTTNSYWANLNFLSDGVATNRLTVLNLEDVFDL